MQNNQQHDPEARKRASSVTRRKGPENYSEARFAAHPNRDVTKAKRSKELNSLRESECLSASDGEVPIAYLPPDKEFKIESGIPIPKMGSRFRQLLKMEIGDSVLFECKGDNTGAVEYLAYNRRRCTSRKMRDGGYRVWRLA